MLMSKISKMYIFNACKFLVFQLYIMKVKLKKNKFPNRFTVIDKNEENIFFFPKEEEKCIFSRHLSVHIVTIKIQLTFE